MTLAEIARRIEQIRPKTLPESICRDCLCANHEGHEESRHVCLNFIDHPLDTPLHDDIARLTLIGAMVMAIPNHVQRDASAGIWTIAMPLYPVSKSDCYHANDPLLSLLAAFEAVYEKEAT